MTRKFFTILFLFSFEFTLFASGGSEESTQDNSSMDSRIGEKLQIVATTSLIADAIEHIGMDHVDIHLLIEEGQDPHGYELVSSDIRAVEDSQVVFVNGFNLEENMLDTIQKIENTTIIEVSNGIEALDGDHDEDHHHEDSEDDDEHHDDESEEEDHEDEHNHEIDPHTWMSINNMIIWIENIKNTLISLDPANQENYEVNFQSYKNELIELDQWIQDELSSIPHENRILIADHSVFGYFGQDYHFETLGAIIPSLSTNAQPSSRSFAELIEEIEEHDVPAIFISTISNQAVQGLATALNDELESSIKVQTYLSGSLTREYSSYEDFMKYNVQQIVDGLSR